MLLMFRVAVNNALLEGPTSYVNTVEVTSNVVAVKNIDERRWQTTIRSSRGQYRQRSCFKSP